MKFLPVFLLSFWAYCLPAQTFQNSYMGMFSLDKIEVLPNGRYLVGGTIYENGISAGTLTFCEADGSPIWSKKFKSTTLPITCGKPVLGNNSDIWLPVFVHASTFTTVTNYYLFHLDLSGNELGKIGYAREPSWGGPPYLPNMVVRNDTCIAINTASTVETGNRTSISVSLIDMNTLQVSKKKLTFPLTGTFQCINLQQFQDGSLLFTVAKFYSLVGADTSLLILVNPDWTVNWAKKMTNVNPVDISISPDNESILISHFPHHPPLSHSLLQIDREGNLQRLLETKYPNTEYFFSGRGIWSKDGQSIWMPGHMIDTNTQLNTAIYKFNASTLGCEITQKFDDCPNSQVIDFSLTNQDELIITRIVHNYLPVITKIDSAGGSNGVCFKDNIPCLSIIPLEPDSLINSSNIGIQITNANPPILNIPITTSNTSSEPNPVSCFKPPAYPFPSLALQYCKDDTLTLSIPVTSSIPEYTWLITGALPDTIFGAEGVISFPDTGTYKVQLFQQYGYCLDSFSSVIHVNIPDYLPQHLDTMICHGNSIITNIAVPDGNYFWDDGVSSPFRTLSESGAYSVLIEQNGCLVYDTFDIEVFTPPALLAPQESLLCQNTLLTPLTQENVTEWSWNGLPATPPFRLDSTGTQTLKALFDNGCIKEESFWTELRPCDSGIPVYIPNTFTPASNDDNRYFSLFTQDNVYPLAVQIFDRWGNMVYATTEGVWPRWDGDVNGKPAPAGVYTALIRLRFPDLIEKSFYQSITLLR